MARFCETSLHSTISTSALRSTASMTCPYQNNKMSLSVINNSAGVLCHESDELVEIAYVVELVFE